MSKTVRTASEAPDPTAPRARFTQKTSDLGQRIDVTDIGDTLELLDRDKPLPG